MSTECLCKHFLKIFFLGIILFFVTHCGRGPDEPTPSDTRTPADVSPIVPEIVAGPIDSDQDTIPDERDNCKEDPNLDQADLDLDKIGDVCDRDDDNDGFGNRCDNCPNTPNADQKNLDRDALGTACDQLEVQWSENGRITNLPFCVPIIEPLEPATHGWDNNFICSETDFGLAWSHSGAMSGQTCVQLKANGHQEFGWDNNFLCSSQKGVLEGAAFVNRTRGESTPPNSRCQTIREIREIPQFPLIGPFDNVAFCEPQ